MKAIILTYAPINTYEKEILQKTKIYKLGLNHHASELNPNARIITDYVLPKICQKFPNDKIISVRQKLRCPSEKIEYFDKEFRGATIISAVDYLISKNFNQLLIVGNNTVNGDEFCNLVNSEMKRFAKKALIYQYSNGNFQLPVMSIERFVD